MLEKGEIYRLRFPASTQAFVSTQALVNETCDGRRFKKSVGAPLKVSRLFFGNRGH
jgi:cytochrome P450/NADPH-cytochrome P450 reductase